MSLSYQMSVTLTSVLDCLSLPAERVVFISRFKDDLNVWKCKLTQTPTQTLTLILVPRIIKLSENQNSYLGPGWYAYTMESQLFCW